MFRLAAGGRANRPGGDELEIGQIDRPAYDFAFRAISGNRAAIRATGTDVGAASQMAAHSWTLANFFIHWKWQ
jgi:hypothetical protein